MAQSSKEQSHNALLEPDVLKELDKEHDDEIIWWKNNKKILMLYPTPGGNDENQLLENNNNKIQNYGGIEEQQIQTSPNLDVLKIIYRKLLWTSLVVFICCGITLIIGLFDEFYQWMGITFNSMSIFASLIGILCGIYSDKKSSTISNKKCKLKLLLSYFIISFIFCLIIFGIQLVYLILIPFRYYHDRYASITSIEQFSAYFIGYILGIIFWFIFALFYVDIVARSVLKRGRIEWIIVLCTHSYDDNNHDYVTKTNIWWIIYVFIIGFRLKFRSIRKILRIATGISCFYKYNDQYKDEGKIDDEIVDHVSSSHEEDNVIMQLEEGDTNIKESDFKKKEVLKNCGNICIQIICYPFKCVCNGIYWIFVGVIMFICCPCVCVYWFFDGNIIRIFQTICCIVLIYIFFPIFVYLLIFGVWALLIFGCIRVTHCKQDDFDVGLLLVAGCLLAIPFWIWLWCYQICFAYYQQFIYLDWSYKMEGNGWNRQCELWDATSIIIKPILQTVVVRWSQN